MVVTKRDDGLRGGTRWATASLGVLVAICSVVSGCGFRTLRLGLERGSEQAAIEGHASVRGKQSGPIVVVAHDAETNRVAELFVLPRPAPFFLVLPAGTYNLAAFEDRDRDLAYDGASEPAVLSAGGPLVVEAGGRLTGLDLVVDAAGKATLPFAVNAVSAERHFHQLPAPQMGTIVDIDDPRFSEENGKLGLWDPLKFLTDVGAGVYFLEEFDPKKIPVLFVHGATGHPAEWKYLIEQLDRTRFQPWLAYYPTAPHLDQLGRRLVRVLGALQAKYDFDRMVLVAHSMGGLVTRAAINEAVASASKNRVVMLPAFVSISSPWNGHAAAAKGVEYAPVVAPSWEDMVPRSPFLTGLAQTPLPPECDYTMLFSYRGGSVGGEAGDGSVALASELWLPIQRQANRVLGFDETHTSILLSPEVASELNAALDRATR